MNIIFVGLLICVIFIAQSTTTNPNLDDKLTDKEIENSVQCYEPSQDRENFCSVFPFRTTVGGPLQQSTLALISASAICDKAENLLHVHKIFGCYVGLGICHPGKTWSIPKGSSVDGFKEMLRTQTFKVVGNTDKREPVMCKSTCKQAIDLIMSCNNLGIDLEHKICSELPDEDCIDNAKMVEFLKSGSSAKGFKLSSVTFLSLCVSLTVLSIFF
ncbi:hypothetical protein HMI54_001600 [Coelomomyces lativittatus]|nr:hypothetical protein HMI56_001157 [Coelomomyces lativittatus]KAJ1510431.1 hypothetical protein HMI54_001600 [Coelomomyces lativittatus]